MRLLVALLAGGMILATLPQPAVPQNASPQNTAPKNDAPRNSAPPSAPKSAAGSAAPDDDPAPSNRIAFAPANPGIKSIGTMSDLMLQMIFPTSNELFYVGRNEEKTQKDWNDLRNNMLMMAEAANLLMADNRAKDKDRWMKDAWLLWDVGDRAYKLAKAKDLEGLKALNADLYEACQSCHVDYRPGYKRRL